MCLWERERGRERISSKNSLLPCWQIWSASITERQIYLHMTHITHHFTDTHTHWTGDTYWREISFTSLIRLGWFFSLFSSLVQFLSESFLPRGIEIDDKFSLCQAANVHLRAFPPLSQYVFQSGKFSHKTSALFICPLMLAHSLSLFLSLSQRSVAAQLSYWALEKLLNVLLFKLINSKDTINWKICTKLKEREWEKTDTDQES